MIRCYYTKEKQNKALKTGRYMAISCLGVVFGLMFAGEFIYNNSSLAIRDHALVFAWVLLFFGLWYFGPWLSHYLAVSGNASDEITLDDNNIRLVQWDGTQITLPRRLLVIESSYRLARRKVFEINVPFGSGPAIILTSEMENAKELVETIQPGSWDFDD